MTVMPPRMYRQPLQAPYPGTGSSGSDRKTQLGVLLGVNAGPAANPTADWAQIEASFFTQLRLWQRHQLSRDGALYILSTHVFSRTWFLARYRPPSPQLVKRLDSAAVKYFWKRSLGDSGAGVALAAFRVEKQPANYGPAALRPDALIFAVREPAIGPCSEASALWHASIVDPA